MRLRSQFFLLLASLAAAPAHAAEIDFARDIRPILSNKCFSCHGPDEEHRKAGLRLDVKETAFAVKDGIAAFRPGDLEGSESWYRITTDDPDELMPPPKIKKPLTEEEKEKLRLWIEDGTEWTDHWAFIAPKKEEAPAVEKDLHQIDAFVRETLKQKGLQPSPEADRRTLIRRVTFDLTGLPPTMEEVEAFVKDQSPNAWEKVVDRLLASPHFGERMALYWLDAARYGDTSVMHADGPRTMWPWRDWVVNAWNTNQPFDQFSIEQIAGDLLPNATQEQKIASGFNRNHPSSDEGGAIAEELRVSYVVDRVKTTSNVWLGLSMECAQCHDHKYDPISQKEYFEFYAYFNNTADPGMQTRRGNQAPVVEVLTDVDEERLANVRDRIETLKTDFDAKRTAAIQQHVNWLKEIPGDQDKAADLETRLNNLKHYFPLNTDGGRLVADVIARKDGVSEADLASVAGKHDGALNLKGKKPVQVPDFPEYDHKHKLTFSAWVKINPEHTGYIFSRMDPKAKFRGYDFVVEKGRFGVHLINSWPNNAIKVLTNEAFTSEDWQHLTVTYDGSGTVEAVKLYLNGELKEGSLQGNSKKLTATMKTGKDFLIGARHDGGIFPGQLDDLRIYDRVLKPADVGNLQIDLVAEALTTKADQRLPVQKNLLRETWLSTEADQYRQVRQDQILADLEEESIINDKDTSMIMADNSPEKMRPTFILDRGMYDSPKEDEEIFPATPAILPPLPDDAPSNRLALADWFFREDHPLTSRVVMNQFWQLFFGTGLVSTPADFGAQGDFPSHPELLDWLAVDFRESGWDVKRALKQILMTQTYRQSSNVDPAHLEQDTDNRLLARAPRHRLLGEMIRDNALALSGLLVEEMGGPGVKPYQPPGLWAEVGLGGNPKFVQDKGEKLYRRSLYTYWKRSAPHPAMLIFDAPNRETCVIKRPNTNTPLQALAAMNDVQMMEASRHLAERILKEGGDTEEARARWAFELATARTPESGELRTILDVYRTGVDEYQDEAQSLALLSAGESPRDESLNASEHAAWTVVSSMLLNLDEVLTRN